MLEDDIDDSMAANPEPATTRGDLGYGDTLAPRSRRPRGDRDGRWVVEFREGDAPRPATASAPKTCRQCGAAVTILHSVGDAVMRTHCGDCQGQYNRDRIGGGR